MESKSIPSYLWLIRSGAIISIGGILFKESFAIGFGIVELVIGLIWYMYYKVESKDLDVQKERLLEEIELNDERHISIKEKSWATSSKIMIGLVLILNFISIFAHMPSSILQIIDALFLFIIIQGIIYEICRKYYSDRI